MLRFVVFGAMFVASVLMVSVPVAYASSGEGKAESGEAVLPGNVFKLDKVVTTIVLPEDHVMRQIAADIWLELASQEHRGLVSHIQPKLLNAFLRDFQRYFYRDTKYRAEKVEKGNRGFHYEAPPLLTPPKPKLDEDGKEVHDESAKDGEEAKPEFSPFQPTTNQVIAVLQARLLATCNRVLGENIVKSVQVRGLFDQWPNER
ncbi:hypothetical protein [Thalassospira sp. TSL5-1]|uniref:hypothetical protein n=1 Tax=Thalassospira sp. TSL5-1 TaxID=1544451 RepID=UPI0011612D8D|nr:hypothetical protein [Thalassospira sp. TSL5-1]